MNYDVLLCMISLPLLLASILIFYFLPFVVTFMRITGRVCCIQTFGIYLLPYGVWILNGLVLHNIIYFRFRILLMRGMQSFNKILTLTIICLSKNNFFMVGSQHFLFLPIYTLVVYINKLFLYIQILFKPLFPHCVDLFSWCCRCICVTSLLVGM